MAADHVCPWWAAWTFDNPLRRLIHKPERMFDGLVTPGMRVLDVGCGMGYFTRGLARMVGPGGTVCAVDLQRKMLDLAGRRLRRAGLIERVNMHLAGKERMGLPEDAGPFDFALAFWMVHETPDTGAFLAEVAHHLKPGGILFVAEPRGHVTAPEFGLMIQAAAEAGLHVMGHPGVAFSRTVTLARAPEG
jgi:ubiquinone/menaquinone biosynthesis C-methylase UbiE